MLRELSAMSADHVLLAWCNYTLSKTTVDGEIITRRVCVWMCVDVCTVMCNHARGNACEWSAHWLWVLPSSAWLTLHGYHCAPRLVCMQVANFGSDWRDGEVLAALVHRISPRHCPVSVVKEVDHQRRLQVVLKALSFLHPPCGSFVTVDHIAVRCGVSRQGF